MIRNLGGDYMMDGSGECKYWWIGDDVEVSWDKEFWPDEVRVKSDLSSVDLRKDELKFHGDFYYGGRLIRAVKAILMWTSADERAVKWVEEHEEELKALLRELHKNYMRKTRSKGRELEFKGRVVIRMDGTTVVSNFLWKLSDVKVSGSRDVEELYSAFEEFLEWMGVKEGVVTWYKENEDGIKALIRELTKTYDRAMNRIKSEVEERESKIAWWYKVKRKEVESFYSREVASMRDMRGSMYPEGGSTYKGSRKLASELEEHGKLVDKVVLKNQYDNGREVKIYEYNGKKYGVEGYWFTNGWGMDVDETKVYEILE